MATLLDPFPDAELVSMDILRTLGTTVTATPESITGTLFQVERIGGPDDGVTDRPRIKVTAFGATRPAAWQMIRQAQEVFHAAAGTIVTGPNTAGEYPRGVFIDKVFTSTPPKQVPESGRGSRQIEAVYEMHYRRPWW